MRRRRGITVPAPNFLANNFPRKIILNGHQITHASSLFKRVFEPGHCPKNWVKRNTEQMLENWGSHEKNQSSSPFAVPGNKPTQNRTFFSSTLLTLEGEVWTLEWNKWDFVTSTQLWKIECNLTWKTCNYWLDLTHSHTKKSNFCPAFSFLMSFWTKYGRLK